MKEITRIHIAKIAYDIELSAKEQLEKYIQALEKYAQDQEILDDIEIRITELLAERGVQSGGVITIQDVTAARERLGEPSEFALEDADKPGVDDGVDTSGESTRKLYRDGDSAIVGGVLAGIARFFRTEPLYLRLIFIVLLIGSAGMATIVYLILWLVVPPARTAAEKLQMGGKSVTLEAIKQLGEQQDTRDYTAESLRRIVRYGAGVVLVLGAIGALTLTIAAAGSMIFGYGYIEPLTGGEPMSSGWLAVALGLFTLAGLLLSALGFILASAAFRKRWSKRMSVTVITIIAAGLLTFSSGVMIMAYGHREEIRTLQAAVKQTKADLPREFANIKTFIASAHSITTEDGQAGSDLAIQYRVTTGLPHYELTALPDIKPDIKVTGDKARVVLKSSATQQYARGWVVPQMIIYGPALDAVSVEQGTFEYAADYPDGQDSLKVSTLMMTQVNLSGSFKSLELEGAGQVNAEVSTVANLSVKIEAGGSVSAGVVRTLTVTQPDVCPARSDYDEQNQLTVQAVSSGAIVYNGKKLAAQTVKHECGGVIVGEED